MAEPHIIPIQTPAKGLITAPALGEPVPGSLIAARDFFPRDCKTGRARLAIRPGYAVLGANTNAIAGFGILGNAHSETGGVQLFAMTSTTLYRWATGSTWSSCGTITTSASRTIHAASYGKVLYIATNAPYEKCDYDANNNGTPDWTIDAAHWTASNGGTIPPNCRIVATFEQRMVLAASVTVGGTIGNPNIVYFSRSGDPLDWNFTATDSQAACYFPIDEAITAAFQHNKNCFVLGTKSGMWIVLGNPSVGAIQKIDFTGGPINSSAWCKGNDGYTYVLTHNGLFRMAAGCGSPLEEVSRNLIPDSLIGLDGTNSTAYLVYDERFRCVHIYVEGTNAQRWLFDVNGGGFWPITAPAATILAAVRFGLADSATASGALVGTASGVMRLDSATALGGASTAYAEMLIPLAPMGQKALIQKAILALGSNTDDTTGTVTIYGGATATLTAAKTADRKSAPIAVSALLANHGTWFPRVGGQFVLVRFDQGDTTKFFSLDGGALYAIPNGLERG